MSEKSNKMTWHSEWTPCLEKFSEKSFRACSPRNQTKEGVGSEEEDALERRGFQDEANLRFSAMTHSRKIESEAEERNTQKSPKNSSNI